MHFLRSLFLTPRLFAALGALIVLFTTSYAVPFLLPAAQTLVWVLGAMIVVEVLLLWSSSRGMHAERTMEDRLSNGDENEITIRIESFFRLPVRVRVIDELPPQFQRRDVHTDLQLPAGGSRTLRYTVRPVERGEYNFGALHLYASTPLGLLRRRITMQAERNTAVYPSYIQLRRYSLLALHDRLEQAGVKRVRRLGHTMEFEQIRDYVPGDDARTVNWKATARRSRLMVNVYEDERSQPIYNVIDKGRAMRMPFAGMTLLDYAINSALVLSNIALMKGDRAGLITYADRVETVIPAERRGTQMQRIIDRLYNERTDFLESDLEALATTLRTRVTQRSLLLLYTNLESLVSLERTLPWMRRIARNHLLVTIIFENTELKELLTLPPTTLDDVYYRTIGEKFVYEKRRIVRELQSHGVYTILTTPQALTADTINTYLAMKARRLI